MDRPSRGSAREYAPLPEEQQAASPQTPQRHCDTVCLGAGAAPQPSSSLDNAGRQRRPSSVLRDSLDNAGTTHKIEQLELKLLRRRDLYTFAGDHYQRLYRMLTIPTIILTASTGLVSAAWAEGEHEVEDGSGEGLLISRTVVVSSLSAIATVLVSVNSLLKYESTHIAFFKAAQQCDTLSTKIGFLSSYNIVSKRDEEIQSIMSEVEKNLIEISSYVPPIPAWLINKFRRAAQAAGMKHVMTSNEVLRREIREMAQMSPARTAKGQEHLSA